MSIRELERLSGVHRSILSMAENGRLVPSGEEWDRVQVALAAERQGPVPSQVPDVSSEPAPG